MKYAPEPPPPITVPEAGAEVKALAGLRAAKPVQERTLPPMIAQQHNENEAHAEAAKKERAHDGRLHGERRKYCRRTEHRPSLLELRSGEERRRHNQRASDLTEHVDIKT